MKVGLGILWEVEIDDHIDGLNVYTTSQKVRANEVAADTISEVMEHAIAAVLQHLGVGIEARVSEFSDLLGQKLNSIGRIAEDDGLIDLEFREKGVQAVNFLLLLHEAVVLCDTSKGELVHKIDFPGIFHVFVLENVSILSRKLERITYLKMLYCDGKSSAEKHDLSFLGVKTEQLLNCGRELRREKLVSFIHYKSCALF